MQLSVKGLALASGVVLGFAIFISTLVAAGRGVGLILSHLSVIFIGYQVSFLGSLIGFVYGFVTGLIAGAVFGAIYNAMLKRARP
jgi:cell shape-determining protein MreD